MNTGSESQRKPNNEPQDDDDDVVMNRFGSRDNSQPGRDRQAVTNQPATRNHGHRRSRGSNQSDVAGHIRASAIASSANDAAKQPVTRYHGHRRSRGNNEGDGALSNVASAGTSSASDISGNIKSTKRSKERHRQPRTEEEQEQAVKAKKRSSNRRRHDQAGVALSSKASAIASSASDANEQPAARYHGHRRSGDNNRVDAALSNRASAIASSASDDSGNVKSTKRSKERHRQCRTEGEQGQTAEVKKRSRNHRRRRSETPPSISHEEERIEEANNEAQQFSPAVPNQVQDAANAAPVTRPGAFAVFPGGQSIDRSDMTSRSIDEDSQSSIDEGSQSSRNTSDADELFEAELVDDKLVEATLAPEEGLEKKRRFRLVIAGFAVAVVVAVVVAATGAVAGKDNANNGTEFSKQATGLTMSLVGVENSFDDLDTELWINVTKTFVEDFFQNRRLLRNRVLQISDIQDVATVLELTETKVVPGSLRITYSQAFTYTSKENNISIESLVMEPFRTSVQKVDYLTNLKASGESVRNGMFDELIEVSFANWQPLFQILHGNAAFVNFGCSVSLSRDGNAMAVGAPSVSSTEPGVVSVFRMDQAKQEWTRLGEQLIVEAKGDTFGESVSLNGDGTILAIGGDNNDAGGDDAGHVRVFEYVDATNRWVQLGSDLDGHGSGDRFGDSVSLNEAGDILAVGSQRVNEGAGSVQLFQYFRDRSSWNQLGQTLVGESTDDRFGRSVSLNEAGNIVGVGAPFSGSVSPEAGQVHVYEYDATAKLWVPVSDPINSIVSFARFGWSVSLDDSGLIVGIGAPGSSERALVYAYDSATSTWIQRGQTILTSQDNDEFGFSVSLSGDGNVLAVGSISHNFNGIDEAGQVGVFEYKNNTSEWVQMGQDLIGESPVDLFGSSVALSVDGTIIGVGAPNTDVAGTDSGSVYTFRLIR